ncbi:MAG: hypothetical protein ACXWLG_10585 [Myxococcaceae bacterium]
MPRGPCRTPSGRRPPGDFDAPALAALLVQIALINVWNRFNVPVRQVAGAAWS